MSKKISELEEWVGLIFSASVFFIVGAVLVYNLKMYIDKGFPYDPLILPFFIIGVIILSGYIGLKVGFGILGYNIKFRPNHTKKQNEGGDKK